MPAGAGRVPGRAAPRVRTRQALRVLAAGRLPAHAGGPALPRLRFDRVAQRLVRSLRARLQAAVPARRALVITVTAPIRLPARTVAEATERLRRRLPQDFDGRVCGNRVRARLLPARAPEAPRVIVLVHNPRPGPAALFRLVAGWLSSPGGGR
jgi:hypothetical protein